MAWTKLDDRFWSHPKIIALSDPAHRIYITSLNWSVSHLTDGHVPESILPALYPKNTRRKAVVELVNVGLWKPHDSDGYVIHDYAEYQPTKAGEEERKRADRERKARGRRKDSAKSPDGIQTDSVRSHTAPTRPDPLPTSNEVGTRTETQQSHDSIVAALIDVHGEPATEREWGKYHDTAKRLRDGQVTPVEYPRLVDAFRLKHGDGVSFGVATVSNRIGELRHHLAKAAKSREPVVVDPESCRHPVVGSVDGVTFCAACGTELEDGAA